MDITKFIINYRRPSRYIYGGSDYIEIYKPVGRVFKRTQVFENASIFNIDNYGIEEIKRELAHNETGLVLNSANFIFNILEFEKIPFWEKLRKDLVQWRLQKVFPEDIGLYQHDFFKVDRNKMLSILFKKALKEQVEEIFEKNGIQLIYMGNSTIEIINRLRKLKIGPDFFIEVDKSLTVVVFLNNSVPYYIRKFRSDKEGDIAPEIVKTVNFVKNNYSIAPASYTIVANAEDFGFDGLREQLAQLEIGEFKLEHKQKLALPA